jgi:hypothetical protein
MRRFLVISGINGHAEALDRLQTMVHERQPDGLLFAGSVLPPWGEDATFKTEGMYTTEAMLFTERFFSTVGSLGLFCAVVPSIFDAPIDHFLRVGMAAELMYPNIHLVHVTPVEEGEMAVFGLGGCIMDYTSTNVGYYSQTLAEYYLRPMLTAEQPRKVLLLSDLPHGWRGELANSRLADALINTYHPAVCVIGRPGAKGRIERVARTLIIHPGYLADGCAAWFDWERPGDDKAELLDLR